MLFRSVSSAGLARTSAGPAVASAGATVAAGGMALALAASVAPGLPERPAPPELPAPPGLPPTFGANPPPEPAAPPAPAAVRASDSPSPRARCGTRSGYALYQCLQAQCAKRGGAQHAQCRRLRQQQSLS